MFRQKISESFRQERPTVLTPSFQVRIPDFEAPGRRLERPSQLQWQNCENPEQRSKAKKSENKQENESLEMMHTEGAGPEHCGGASH